MKNLIAFVLFSILLIACSKQTDIDPALQVKSSGLFTYTIISEGDGNVTFKADSTQIIKEYLWDFNYSCHNNHWNSVTYFYKKHELSSKIDS